MNVRLIITKTIEAATPAALDAAVAAFVQGLADEQFVGLAYSHISGSYSCCITYVQ